MGGKSAEREISLKSGTMVLDALRKGGVDAHAFDPRDNGLEALKAIRLMTRGRERLPVVILSADVTVEAKRECLEAGADSFVPKPVEALKLLDELKTLTAGRERETPRVAQATAAPAPAAADLEIVNGETLGHLDQLGSTPDFLERLVGVFVADSLSLLAKMESAIAARNFGEFRAHLHAMKGSAASIGTERLTRRCAILSRYSDAELRLQSSTLVRSLSEEFETGRAALERYVQEKQSRSAS